MPIRRLAFYIHGVFSHSRSSGTLRPRILCFEEQP
jgi:hypothetical protein